MRSPDATDVERIEGLLRGMPPETEREAHLEGMIRELRSVSPRASHELRERVRTLREPERRRSLGWRPVLVVVPVALAFAGAAILGRGDDTADQGAAFSRESATALEAQPAPQAKDADALRRPARTDARRCRARAGVGRLARARRARQPQPLRRERRGDPHDARARRLRRLVERRDAGSRRTGRPRAAHPAAPRPGRDRAVLRARHDHRPAGHGAGPAGRPRPAREADRHAADPARRGSRAARAGRSLRGRPAAARAAHGSGCRASSTSRPRQRTGHRERGRALRVLAHAPDEARGRRRRRQPDRRRGRGRRRGALGGGGGRALPADRARAAGRDRGPALPRAGARSAAARKSDCSTSLARRRPVSLRPCSPRSRRRT